MSHNRNGMDITSWIQAMFCRTLRWVTDCHITSVEHWKYARGIGHEFLIIAFDNTNYFRYIKLERSAKRSRSLSDFTESMLSMGAAVESNDIISISITPFDTTNCFTVHTVDFTHTSTPLTIADLVAVLNAVREKAPKYRLYKHMCYWFARAVFEGLAYICHGHTSNGERPQARGRFLRLVKLSSTIASPDHCSVPGCTHRRRLQGGSVPHHVERFRARLDHYQHEFVEAERPAPDI